MSDIKQLIPEGFCLKCDGCCRFTQKHSVWFPHLLKSEEKAIPKDKFCAVPDKKNNNFLCSFFRSDDNKCKIYESRPFECCLYPFLLNYDAASGRIFLAVNTDCPFVKENLGKEEFKKYVRYLEVLFTDHNVSKLLKSNPQVIQSYPDVPNLAEIKI